MLHSDHLYKGDHFTLSLRLELSQTTTLSMHNPIHLIPLLSIDQLTVIKTNSQGKKSDTTVVSLA